jgi:hypothetical protein
MSDGIVPLTPAQVIQQEELSAKEGFIKRDLIALDMFANVLTGGNEDETISSRLARGAEQHHVVGEVGTKILNLFESNHCVKAQAGDVYRATTVEKLEKQSGGFE